MSCIFRIEAAYRNFAACGQKQRIQMPDKRGFAAAVWADQGKVFTFSYLQRNTPQGINSFRLIFVIDIF
jgi:hypothetical protein